MFIRLLLLGALVLLAWYALRRVRDTLAAPPEDPRVEDMARCDECGVYVPRSQLVDGRCARCR
jgi:hypothetical protein